MLNSAYAGSRGVDTSFHLQLPFMNRLNHIEPATCYNFVVCFGLSLGVSIFMHFKY